MVEPVNEAATAAASASEACFGDDLLFLDFPSVPSPPPSAGNSAAAAAAGGMRRNQTLLFQEIFDPSDDGLAGLVKEDGGDEAEEEELEWLSNKDAFPTLETSFEIPSHSRSSSSGASVAAAGATAERSSPICVLAAASLSVPARPRSKGRRRRRRVLTGLSPPALSLAVQGSKRAATPVARKTASKEPRRCRHCEAEETPQWRAGPEGPKTLCNACGVRYKSGRLVPEYRPASSPTFSAAIHSNSHRRILEMRRRKPATVRRKSNSPPPPFRLP